MKLIDYDKYQKKWNPRSVVVLLVVEALATGFFLALALMEGIHSHNSWDWIWPLALGFGSAVGVLQAGLIVLHNCRASTQAQETEATVR
jgi:hypothetical protein